MKRWIITVTAALALGTGWALAAAQKKDLDIKAPDGANLKASYFSPDRPGPAILLIHQCNMDRHSWDSLANDLVSAGFHVLTFDLRGFGESDGKTTNAVDRQAAREKWPADVDAMFAYLLAQKDVDRSRVAAGGASCAVGLSADLAARHHEITALIGLSGGASEQTKGYIAQTPELAIFGTASEGDTTNPAAPKATKELLATSRNPQSQLHMYPGTEHGVPLYTKHSELEPMIVSWLMTRLKANGNSR